MSNFIQDIENLFSGIKSALTSPATTGTALSSIDVVKKTVALAQTAEHLAATFANDAETTWASLDNLPLANIASSVVGLVHTGDYEKAAFGLMYLVYQGAIEATNKVESAVQGIIPGATTNVQPGATAPAPTVDTTASTPVTPENKAPGVIGVAEEEVGKLWVDVTSELKNVVHKVEGVFESAPTPAATTTAAPAPTAQATPVQATTPAPVVAAENPPQTAPVVEQAPVVPAKPVLAS